jgi:hypothetical protein
VVRLLYQSHAQNLRSGFSLVHVVFNEDLSSQKHPKLLLLEEKLLLCTIYDSYILTFTNLATVEQQEGKEEKEYDHCGEKKH